eukprot:9282347-Prorocentrum_lima.AAC.1
MTSSLVGSEMCIRDRLRIPSIPDYDFAIEADELHSPSPARGGVLHNFEDCLLYTSDAADDM